MGLGKIAEGATVTPRPMLPLPTVQLALESLSSFRWNHCPGCAGIRVQLGPEFAPSSLRYDLPVNVAISLLPAFRVSDKFTVFAEAGLALGKIRERKVTTNVAMSGYDEDKWRPGIVTGFGVSLALDDRWSLRAGYRRTWYKDHDFNTYRANGTQVEAVTSRVVQSTTIIGLIRKF